MLYVPQNEHTNRSKVITAARDREQVPTNLKKDLAFLNKA